MIGKLEHAGASDIVFDVDFSSPSDPVADQAFADALRKAGGGSVVLPAFRQLVAGGDGKTIHVNRPLPQFEKNAWSAIVNVAVEPDGLVRRYSFGESLNGKFLPSVGALLAGNGGTLQGLTVVSIPEPTAWLQVAAIGLGAAVVRRKNPSCGAIANR